MSSGESYERESNESDESNVDSPWNVWSCLMFAYRLTSNLSLEKRGHLVHLD